MLVCWVADLVLKCKLRMLCPTLKETVCAWCLPVMFDIAHFNPNPHDAPVVPCVLVSHHGCVLKNTMDSFQSSRPVKASRRGRNPKQ